MNINLRPHTGTTSSFMTANNKQIAMFPVVVYTRIVEGGPILKLGYIFLSDDLKHDYHQVAKMEKIVYDQYEARFGCRPLGSCPG